MCSWALAMSRASGLVGAVVVVVVDVVVAGAGECSIAAVEPQRIDETEPEAALAVPGEPSDRQKDGVVVVVVVDTAGTLVLVVLVAEEEEEQGSRTPERRIERVAVLDSSNHLPCPSCWHFSAVRSVFLDGTSLA